MKFGIFYEHQIGRPWEDDALPEHWADARHDDDCAAGRRDPTLGIVG
jgi:hypothetical protein